MRHLRSDYDAIQPWPTKRPHIVKVDGEVKTVKYEGQLGQRTEPLIPDDEPVFLLRATDPVGPDVVRMWANYAQAAGSDEALCDRVRVWADEMEAYQRASGRVAPPDVPDGMLR